MTMRRLRIVNPCDEDFERMRPLADGVRFCDVCAKRVVTVSTDSEADALIRSARKSNERWACIRVVVAAAALTACAHPLVYSVQLSPTVSSAPSAANSCAINPSACASTASQNCIPGINCPGNQTGGINLAATAKRHLSPTVGEAPIPQTVWARFYDTIRRAVVRAF